MDIKLSDYLQSTKGIKIEISEDKITKDKEDKDKKDNSEGDKNE